MAWIHCLGTVFCAKGAKPLKNPGLWGSSERSILGKLSTEIDDGLSTETTWVCLVSERPPWISSVFLKIQIGGALHINVYQCISMYISISIHTAVSTGLWKVHREAYMYVSSFSQGSLEWVFFVLWCPSLGTQRFRWCSLTSSVQISFGVTAMFKRLAYRFPTVKVVTIVDTFLCQNTNPLQNKRVAQWDCFMPCILFYRCVLPTNARVDVLQCRGSILRCLMNVLLWGMDTHTHTQSKKKLLKNCLKVRVDSSISFW